MRFLEGHQAFTEAGINQNYEEAKDRLKHLDNVKLNQKYTFRLFNLEH